MKDMHTLFRRVATAMTAVGAILTPGVGHAEGGVTALSAGSGAFAVMGMLLALTREQPRAAMLAPAPAPA